MSLPENVTGSAYMPTTVPHTWQILRLSANTAVSSFIFDPCKALAMAFRRPNNYK